MCYRVTIVQKEIRYTVSVFFINRCEMHDHIFQMRMRNSKKLQKTPCRQHLTSQRKYKKNIIHIFYFRLISFYNEIFKLVLRHYWESI